MSSVATQWNLQTSSAALPPAEMHLWRFSLEDVGLSHISDCEAVLNGEERQRAARFFRDEIRFRWMSSRAGLRRILAGYVGQKPQEIQFSTNAFGKPDLAVNPSGLRFNLSHSHDRALVGVVAERTIGVDIEQMRPQVEIEELAARFFAASELARLRALRHEERRRAFFDCWTRKEAYIKARGDGLSRRLDSFVVAFGSGAVPAVLSAEDEPDARSRWTVLSFEPYAGFAGAAIVQGRDLTVRFFEHRAP